MYDDGTLFDWFQSLFRKPTAEELAHREMQESSRSLLECQRMKDYYDNMVNFHTKRIASLKIRGRTTEDALGVYK